MERPLKRPLSLSPEPENESEDDSSHVGLQAARAQNDLRLKSIFEGIFEKYGRDFTDVGDEIDLQTGDILVNNGHLHTIDEEDNAATIEDWLLEPDTSAECMKEESSRHHHTQRTDDSDSDQHAGRGAVSRLSQMLFVPKKSRQTTDDRTSTTSEAEDDDMSSVDSLLDTALCVQGTHARELGTGETVTEKANSLAAEESNQSTVEHNGRLDEAVDPIWRVPEISPKWTAPTMLNKSIPRPIVTPTRIQSPPGAGSLWALPSQSRRNTDVVKRRKQKDSPKKRKNDPPKPVARDWSFADTPDGSESDDPLQDHEPSPTPKGAVYIREKRRDPFVESRTKNTCNYCNISFTEGGYVSHLQAALSDPADNGHDLIHLKKELEMITQRSGRSIDSPTPGLNPEDTNHESTPIGTKRARTIIAPDEARLIIRMKVTQGMKWKDILDHFPQKKLFQLHYWFGRHWNERHVNPPRSSKPWSKAELARLARIKDQSDLTWPGIRAELPRRSQAEVEFKLLQLWAGGDGGST
ncbi:centromere protein Scm3-domain-containing protein [Aspergillus carlsbadensis]|nr:centromere protein Scm3-domain-containing protein [Aspergillus carlsbadensis]